MDPLFLKDVVIIFALSIGVLLICHRLNLPSIVGFLVTGLVAGPHGFGLIRGQDDVRALAEMGIIILLFTVGIEFSLKKVKQHLNYFLLGGALQVTLTALLGVAIGLIFGRSSPEALFLGFLLSLSSTAIVLRIFQERGESNTPHGRFVAALLIFQDIAVVPMMLLTPLLAGEGGSLDLSLLWTVLKGLLILTVVLVLAEILVPRLLHYVAKTKNRELFLLSTLTIGVGIAYLTSEMGLSLALGAFLAGLILSDSQYGSQAVGDIIPLQDIFTSFFFVSIGMLLDSSFFADHVIKVSVIACGVILLKSLVVFFTGMVLKISFRVALLSAFALAQVGEFSFVLVTHGMKYGLGTHELQQLFLSVAVLTMGATPFLIACSGKFAGLVSKLPLKAKVAEMSLEGEKEGHVLICGYGFSGKNLARSCREASVPYTVLDLDPERVRSERGLGVPIFFGDASHDYVLKHAHIQKARVVAVAVSDPVAALRIIAHARRLNPASYIVVRTSHFEEMHELYQSGADDVIPDEFGSTVEMFVRVLDRFEISREKVQEFVDTLRKEAYDLLRHRMVDTTFFTTPEKDHR